jgi:hypothetical protein
VEQQSRLGMTIGHIECGATACADDITLNCTDPTEAQIMLNMAYNYRIYHLWPNYFSKLSSV